jgi:isopenicillin N synthase-like dioxygenase
MSTIVKSIASVSLNASRTDPEGFARELGESFERFGFAIIADHGIPADLIARGEAQAKAFFALPEKVKRSYHKAGGGGARGYTPFVIETAMGATQYDLKEFWHVGRELPEGHRFGDVMAPNVWPKEVTEFRDTFLELFAAFDTAGLRILEAIARHLGLAPDWFENTVEDGNSVLRLLHYPPRISTPSPCCSAPRKRACNCSTVMANGCRCRRRRESSSSISATCCSD